MQTADPPCFLRQLQPSLVTSMSASLFVLQSALSPCLQEMHLLPLLLDGAACSSALVQQPAAACIANMCADPGLLLEELGV